VSTTTVTMDPTIPIPSVPDTQSHVPDQNDDSNKKRKIDTPEPRTLQQALDSMPEEDRRLLSHELTENNVAFQKIQSAYEKLRQDRTNSGNKEVDALRLLFTKFVRELPQQAKEDGQLVNVDFDKILQPENLKDAFAQTLVAVNSATMHSRMHSNTDAPPRAPTHQKEQPTQLQQAEKALEKSAPPRSTVQQNQPISSQDLMSQIMHGTRNREYLFSDNFIKAHRKDMN